MDRIKSKFKDKKRVKLDDVVDEDFDKMIDAQKEEEKQQEM